MSNVLVEIDKLQVSRAGEIILRDINLLIHKGEQWAIIGASGSGKTSLANALAGAIFFNGEIRYHLPQNALIELVPQQHRFRTLNNTSDFYYQQRYNSADADNSLKVSDLLFAAHAPEMETLAELHVDSLLHKPLIQLSNGENKRVQLARSLIKKPALVILDNPYIGLDQEGRATLNHVIDSVVASGIHVILITSPSDLPPSVTHIASLEKGSIVFSGPRHLFPGLPLRQDKATNPDLSIIDLLREETTAGFETIIDMKDVVVTYGDKQVLDHINWTVKKPECWSVSGPNGAGKSTLLSLITADNPQAYANEIYLFERRRGSGESIWDIKRNIGYVSPELHLYFDNTSTCFNAVASGLFDTIGLFRSLSTAQEEKVNLWMRLLKIEKLKSRLLTSLSGGQQRLVMLARALVKNPPLLILDEPCQGLDEEQSSEFRLLIETICDHFKTTLIYVSHYQKDIPHCVKFFMKLENGRRIL
jgi:molybdate transport system ATP-binding protein